LAHGVKIIPLIWVQLGWEINFTAIVWDGYFLAHLGSRAAFTRACAATFPPPKPRFRPNTFEHIHMNNTLGIAFGLPDAHNKIAQETLVSEEVLR
jgi:hypothetical protein